MAEGAVDGCSKSGQQSTVLETLGGYFAAVCVFSSVLRRHSVVSFYFLQESK